MSAFIVEQWTWYGLIWLIVILRMTSRTLLLGSIKKWQADDLLMMCAMATVTVAMVGMTIISRTSSNLINPAYHVVLTPENIKERAFGSKWVVTVEQMQILTIWTMKTCLLIMYNRLAMSLGQNTAVKAVAGYVAFGFVLMEILYFAVWCKPFHDHWAVPTDNAQCSAATHHLITNAVLNISSDLMIIMIPMPMLISSTLPLKKKAVLCGVFALGLFTILSAVLNKVYSFTDPYGSDWTFWYIRELSTAVIIANLPYMWSLCRRLFNLSSFNGLPARCPTIPSTQFRSNISRTCRSTIWAVDEEVTRIDSTKRTNNTLSIPFRIYQRRHMEYNSEEDLDQYY
ncbi:hypothetical protein EDB80DRAFT_594023 [Ilyonectria destructans]|nr:hypothetical protein EDB80DRAFT_594023 [Ilyonectria destructans]